jgi:hypothetical protein
MTIALRASTAFAVAIALLVATSTANANRTPVRVSGLKHDSWGFTTSIGEYNLRHRYPGIHTVECYGIINVNDVAGSSFIHGLNRYWDKLACAGTTVNGHNFVLICDSKSAKGFIIYRLRDASLSDLQSA